MRSHRYDGYVVQSTGDGIFALFGAPVAHEDHPQRALVRAHCRMQDEVQALFEQLRSRGKRADLQVRVGVNTGEVVVRSITTGASQTEYTPIGHTDQSRVADAGASPHRVRSPSASRRASWSKVISAQAARTRPGQRRQRAGQRV